MMKSRKARLVLIALAVAFMVTAASRSAFSADPTPKQLWDKVGTKWKTVNAYSCNLFIWNFRTPTWMKNHTQWLKPDAKPKWDYRIFDVRFKKNPDKVLLAYKVSKNEDMVTGSLIDVSISYVLTYIPDTTFNFGYKDNKIVYIIFPYIKDKQFNALPVPPKWKAPMKLLMIASRKEVYWKKPEDLRDNRGNLLNEISIGIKMAQFEHYFKDGTVTLSKTIMPTESAYTLNAKSGWLTGKPLPSGNIYKLTMVPKDVKKNKGITKAEVFVDPATNMLVGLQEYEGKQLVQTILFSDLKINPNLPDKLWADQFQGRKLSNTK
jgi:hypothetical protein